MPFAMTYLCESGFSLYFIWKTSSGTVWAPRAICARLE